MEKVSRSRRGLDGREYIVSFSGCRKDCLLIRACLEEMGMKGQSGMPDSESRQGIVWKMRLRKLLFRMYQ